MLNTIHVITKIHEVNTAPANRFMSIVKGLSHSNIIKVCVHYFMPDDNFTKENNTLENVEFIYHWDKKPLLNKYTRWVYYYLEVKRFISKLSSNSNIVIFGMHDLLHLFVKRKDINVFIERNENPEVISLNSRIHKVSLHKYLETCKQVKGLFVMTNALKEYYVSKGIDPKNIEIINMTVDHSRFESLIKNNNERYIVYCGNASNNKDGVDKLIESFSLISSKYPDVKLYIIGPKPKSDADFLNLQLAKKIGVVDKIIFTGSISSDEIPQYLVNAEICALERPNNKQATFGFPTKLGEYLLSKTPVVLTKVGDMPLFLEDNVSVVFSEPDNIEAFACRLDWALTHTEEVKSIGRKGYDVAMKQFNADIEAKKIINFVKCKSSV